MVMPLRLGAVACPRWSVSWSKNCGTYHAAPNGFGALSGTSIICSRDTQRRLSTIAAIDAARQGLLNWIVMKRKTSRSEAGFWKQHESVIGRGRLPVAGQSSRRTSQYVSTQYPVGTKDSPEFFGFWHWFLKWSHLHRLELVPGTSEQSFPALCLRRGGKGGIRNEQLTRVASHMGKTFTWSVECGIAFHELIATCLGLPRDVFVLLAGWLCSGDLF
jgi:hypothetical protein